MAGDPSGKFRRVFGVIKISCIYVHVHYVMVTASAENSRNCRATKKLPRPTTKNTLCN